MNSLSFSKIALALLIMPASAFAQNNIGGDINSIPPEHRVDYLSRQQNYPGNTNALGGDINSIPPEHRAEALRLRPNNPGNGGGGVGVAERIDANGNRQQFINGRWVTISSTKRTKYDSNGNYFEWENGSWVRKNPPGLRPNMPKPTSCTSSGRWRCSCGKVWDLRQNGFQLTGSESGNGEHHAVTGNWSGNEFIFRYQSQTGKLGFGVINVHSGGRTASAKILWNDGTSSRPTLTRM